MPVSFSDNFNRADNTDLGTNWDVQSGVGNMQIVGNTIRAGATGSDRGEQVSTGAFSTALTDQRAQARLAAFTAGGSDIAIGVSLRMAAAAYTTYNFFACGGTLPDALLFKVVDGSGTDIGNEPTVAWAVNDTIGAEVQGARQYFLRNGHPVVRASDNAIASGQPGVFCFVAGAVTDGELDDFSATTYADGPTTGPSLDPLFVWP